MIITRDFVMLNNPKTGSTFLRAIVKKIYSKRANHTVLNEFLIKLRLRQPNYTELFFPFTENPNLKDQHGTIRDMPLQYIDLPMVTAVRNPYDRFISQYNSGFWKHMPLLSQDILNKHFKDFENISLNDFVVYSTLLMDSRKKKFGIPKEINIGIQTMSFLRMFSKNRDEFYKTLIDGNLTDEFILDNIANGKFLKTENLRNEFIDFMEKFGLIESEKKIIKSHSKLNESQRKENTLTEQATRFINQEESLLFRILQ